MFDRFYQSESNITQDRTSGSSQRQKSSGIGLALVKEFVELHRGYIQVKNDEETGSTFVFNIPLGKNHLKADEIVDVSYSPFEEQINKMFYGTVKKVRDNYSARLQLSF